MAVTVALRTQQIVAEESGVTNTIDPLAGSYFVESMTDRLEEEAMDYIRKIDDFGGMVEAVERGYPQREIAASAYRLQQQVESGEKIVVGPVDLAALRAERERRRGRGEPLQRALPGRIGRAASHEHLRAGDADARRMPWADLYLELDRLVASTRGIMVLRQGRSLVVEQSIEPTQVSGFNQFYDEPNGSRSDNYGAAIDARLSAALYSGLEYMRRDVDVQLVAQCPLDSGKAAVPDCAASIGGRE